MKQAQVYTVITDLPALVDFIEWLPELAIYERFYVCLFARKKYCQDVPWVKSDKGQLRRFLSEKTRLLQKIQQLEVPFGAFSLDGNAVPQESLALYLTPNPRDLWKANIRSIKALATIIECKGVGSNPQQEVMSEIHRSCSEKIFLDFDIDSKDPHILADAIKLVDYQCSILQTRGGFHILVRKDAAKKGFRDKLWHKKLSELSDVSSDPHSMIPVPGTYQGGFTPILYKTPEDARRAGVLLSR